MGSHSQSCPLAQHMVLARLQDCCATGCSARPMLSCRLAASPGLCSAAAGTTTGSTVNRFWMTPAQTGFSAIKLHLHTQLCLCTSSQVQSVHVPLLK